MKQKLIKLLFILMIIFSNASAQKKENGKVIITGTSFTYPLVEKWAAEFGKKYPDVPIQIIARSASNVDSANLIINAHTLASEEIKEGYKVTNICKYALLPVANKKNPALKEWLITGIKPKQFKLLFFKKVNPFASKAKEKTILYPAFKPVLYTPLGKACASISFAKNFGFEQQDILGVSISGDDKHLITAIERDTAGVTYNNLGMLYDLNSRKVKKTLAIVPLDLNGNGKLDKSENFYTTLDEVIERLEEKKIPEITTEYVNISYPKTIDESNKNTLLFLCWILENGQQYNHDFGFLNFEKKQLVEQKELLSLY